MSGRASVYQGVQVGVEATPGEAVAANKRLLCTFIDPKPRVSVEGYRPQGSKFTTTESLPQNDHTMAAISGKIGYNDIAYLLTSCLCNPSGAFTFKPEAFGPDTCKTLTVQTGSSVRAEQFTYGAVTALDFEVTRAAVNLTGEMIGQKTEEGATLTASPTALARAVVSPKHVKVYVGDSVGGLTKLSKLLVARFGIKGRHVPGFYVDADEESFTETVEDAPELTSSIVVEHNSVAAGYMADLRTAKQKFLRLHALGPEVSPGLQYEFRVTAPFVFQDNDRGDQDKTYASTFNLIPKFEDGFAGALEVYLVNALGGL